jgi:hypothetical protein
MSGPKCVGAASLVAAAGAMLGFAGLFPAPTKAQSGPVSPTFVASQANAVRRESVASEGFLPDSSSRVSSRLRFY